MAAVELAKADEEQRFLLFVAYSPNRMPFRGADHKLDIATPEVIEKAAWRFVENGSRSGLMHKEGGEGAFRVVENTIYRNPVPWVLKAADGSEVTIRRGDWLVGAILSPEAWADYKAGKYGGASIQGTAKRIPARAKTLAAQRSA